jgi:hypothetical protein
VLSANITENSTATEKLYKIMVVTPGTRAPGLAFLGATLGIMSVMLIGTHGGPIFFPGTSLFHLLGYIGLFFSTVLILRVVIAISREGI